MEENFLCDIEKDISGNWEDIQRNKLIEDELSHKEEFFSLLDSLIALNKKRRRIFYSHLDAYYMKEFCTVSIDFGRQIGKTEYIKKRMTKDDVVIVDRIIYKNYLINRGFNRNKIFTSYDIKGDRIRGLRCKNIYVDDASLFRNKRVLEYDIYEIFGIGNIEQTFILLG